MVTESLGNLFNPDLAKMQLSKDYAGLENVPEDIVKRIETANKFSQNGKTKEAIDEYRGAAFQSRMEFEILGGNSIDRADIGALTLSLYVSGHEVRRARKFGKKLLDDTTIPEDYKPSISNLLGFLDKNPQW